MGGETALQIQVISSQVQCELLWKPEQWICGSCFDFKMLFICLHNWKKNSLAYQERKYLL